VSRLVNVLLLAVFVVSLAAGSINSTKDVLAASPSPTAPQFRNAQLAPGRLVQPQGLPASSTTAHPNASRQFLPRDRASLAAGQQLANQGNTGRRSGVVTVPTGPQVAGRSAPQTQQQLAGFPVMDLSRQVGLYGSNQDVQPPDTQLAAGPTSLAEAVNSSLSIWSKTGTVVLTADLNAFFSVPTGYFFGDPRIVYDAESSRWFLSGVAITSTNNSQVWLAVSTTSDPTGTWRFTLVKSQTAVLADQPMTGVNSDKVVISWNDFSGSPTLTFSGQETWVFEKSDLVSGATLHYSFTAPDLTRFRVVPSQSLTPSTTEWLTYNSGSTFVGVVAITGLPSTSTVVWTETDPAFQATSAPPFPRQPSGVAVTQEIDDRFLSAVRQNGTLWVSGTDACIPAGDSIARACMRLVGISTGGATSTVVQDFDAAPVGTDLYYPAVTLNSSGDLFIAYSESSSTMFPAALAVDSLAASPMAFENPIVLASGSASYLQGTANRWGDYSAAAPDPTNPAHIWVTAEYQGSATLAGNWATATANLAIQPTITNLNPNFGPLAGGTAVTIKGTHFQSGATVAFGANAATNVVVVSGQQITASTPAAAGAGSVNVIVTNPDGTTGTGASAYTYALPVVNAIVPNSGAISGGTSVTITGGNFTGATAVAFGATPATGIAVLSDTQISAVSPSHAVGTVDITVTTPIGTSATTPSDRFTYTPQSLYFTWYDLASPGMRADNIHLLNTSSATANITVTMPGASAINVALTAGQETYVSFGQGHIGGPVVINSDQQILASQRVQYFQTFNEVWAESAAQAAMASYVNWYDKASPGMFNDNIHLLNPGSASASVTVSLPGAGPQVATVAAGGEAYVTFPQGTIGGPLTITSTQPVLASQRVQYYSSFKEVWAESAALAATTSYINWYDKASPGMFNDNIHILNPGTSIATVTVSLPGTSLPPVTVLAGGESYVTFPAGTIGGPVLVSSDLPVLSSQRVQYYSTFNEVWSESAAQAATVSHVTWYDKVSPGMFNDNIHVLNPGNATANVTISLPGASDQIVSVPAGGESFVTFPAGTIGGPVTVTSGQPVLASQRVQYYSSFNEIWAA
jgi:hypothetical protein